MILTFPQAEVKNTKIKEPSKSFREQFENEHKWIFLLFPSVPNTFFRPASHSER